MATKTAMITIAGRPNVGKSTLMNHLVGEKIAIVSNKPQTTRNRICGITTKNDVQYVFVDTPGYHRPRTKLGTYMVNVAKNSIVDVDLTILVVEPIPSIGQQEQDLIEQITSKKCPAILVVNKIDTVELKGKFFKAHVSDGQIVKTGDLLMLYYSFIYSLLNKQMEKDLYNLRETRVFY